MRRDLLRSTLRRLYARPEASRARRDALEAELLESFDRRATTPDPRPKTWRRPVLAVLTATAVVGGACQLPAEYTVDMGTRLGIVIDGRAMDEVDPAAIGAYVADAHPLEQLELSVHREMRVEAGVRTDEVRIQLDMVGDDVRVDPDALWDELRDAFPGLENGARLEEEHLEATVHGTLGGKLSHRMLDVVIDRHGVDEARRLLLEDLERQGLRGHAHVEVREDPDGRRQVEVRVEAERTSTPDPDPE